MLAATRRYQERSDLVTGFLADDSVVITGHGSVLSAPLYRAFTDWCAPQGEEPRMSAKVFAEALAKRRYTGRHTRAGKLWQSITLVDERRSSQDRDSGDG